MERGLEVYQAEEGELVFDVDKNEQTIWATQEEIARLFGVTTPNINMHLKRVYSEGELEENRTIKKNLIVRTEGKRKVKRAVNYYNLDAIISVGYRVNSKKATKFRVWATGVLKKYLVSGVAVNERRIEQLGKEKLEELEGTLKVVKRLMRRTELEEGEAKGILEVISKYGGSLKTIKEYDEGHISFKAGKGETLKRNLTVGDATNLVENLREEILESGEFGRFKDEKAEEKFKEKILELETEKAGKSLAEKAVRLLYYIVKKRPFLDGNRRIAALLFIYFLTINDYHLAENGETKISDRALVATTLLIAESEEKEEELVISLIQKLLED